MQSYMCTEIVAAILPESLVTGTALKVFDDKMCLLVTLEMLLSSEPLLLALAAFEITEKTTGSHNIKLRLLPLSLAGSKGGLGGLSLM